MGKDVVALLLEGVESVSAADAQFLGTPSSEVVERAEKSRAWGGKAARLNGSGLLQHWVVVKSLDPGDVFLRLTRWPDLIPEKGQESEPLPEEGLHA